MQLFNPFTPSCDHQAISPYNIHTISSKKVTRRKKNISKEILHDLTSNSQNWNHMQHMEML